MYFIEKRDLIVLFFVARGCVFIPTKMKMMKLFREYLVNQVINMLESINDQSYLIPRQNVFF